RSGFVLAPEPVSVPRTGYGSVSETSDDVPEIPRVLPSCQLHTSPRGQTPETRGARALSAFPSFAGAECTVGATRSAACQARWLLRATRQVLAGGQPGFGFIRGKKEELSED
ncbi:hypothetical protein PFISCL1PPCAC_4309, partial [Pristionchus fissidentatus]